MAITPAEHSLGSDFSVRIYSVDGSGTFTREYLDYTLSPTGTLTLQVTEVPDFRFLGKVELGE